MTNEELNGLAKNRFISPPLQMAIAQTRYRLAIYKLCRNPSLSKSVRDYIWSNDCNRGYSFKSALLQSGKYRKDPEKYWEMYNKYPGMWTRCPWRAKSTFLSTWSWYGDGPKYTPSDLLETIFDDRFRPGTNAASMLDPWVHGKSNVNTLRRLVEHPNCGLNLAIKLSTVDSGVIRKIAFEKIVQLSK